VLKPVKRVGVKVGRGGMESKIKAAKKVALAGVPTIIANGLKPRI